MPVDVGSNTRRGCSLKCFGVGDGRPSGQRLHSSFLYRFPDQAILIDCGEPIGRSYKASGFDYDLVDRILLSHLHFDHVGGLFMLMQGFWLEGRKKLLQVHAPGDGIEPIRKMLQAGCIFEELFPFPIRYEPLEADRPIVSGATRITAYPTTHLAGLQARFQAKYPQRFEAFSFLIESGGLRIGHSADIGAVTDLAPLVEKPLDLLVCELAHINPEELFRYLASREIGRIVFIHLAQEWVDDLVRLEALAGDVLGKERVAWPRDGDEFEIGVAEPCRRP